MWDGGSGKCQPNMHVFFPRSIHLINDSHLTLYQIHHWTYGINRVKEINFLGILFKNLRFLYPTESLVILKSKTNVYMKKWGPEGLGGFPASQNYNNQTKEGKKKKHAQIFLPVWFFTLKMILVEVGLGDKEMGLVAKLNLSLYLRAIPFHNSVWKQLYHSLLGRACQLPIKDVAVSFLGPCCWKKLSMDSAIKAKFQVYPTPLSLPSWHGTHRVDSAQW